jgi:hypothetical protein
LEEYFDQSKTIAFVYLLSNGDDKNKVLVSNDLMLIIRKGGRKAIQLKEISGLRTENKKLLFPLILGGIITPFAFLSYFVNIFLPWFHLISVLLGMLLFYIGWAGRLSMTVVYKNGEELHYYLPAISKNLFAFIEYINSFLSGNKKHKESQYLFFIIQKEHLNYIFNVETPSPESIFPIYGYTYDQIKLQNIIPETHELIMLNPEKTGREIKFEYDIDVSKMRPMLDGPVLSSARVEIVSF